VVKVEVDMDYHKTMLQLHLKANPKEVLIGWCVAPNTLTSFTTYLTRVLITDEAKK
jgi:translation initiation factor 3 subunit F